MKEGLTEIVCVLDRSGSMGNIITEAIGGLNTFIKDQKDQDGEAKLTMTLFDDQIVTIYDNVDILDVPAIDNRIYFPRGMTALYDAVGSTVTRVGKRLAETAESERPEKVVVAILTDGMNNKFYDYDAESVKTMIEHQEEKYGWQFVFLAANQDAFDVGAGFGMRSHNSIDFNATSKGAKMAFANVSSYSTNVRSMSKSSLDAGDMALYSKVTEDEIDD